ncbi:MAG: hypothetical protein KDK61_03600, partial [Simkania sp.]|nr:hypothetical protein [Simkania sp.]
MRLISLKNLVVTFAALGLMSAPQPSYSGDREKEIAASCAASATIDSGASWAVCVGEGLALEEVKKCLTGGDCFGEGNTLRQL